MTKLIRKRLIPDESISLDSDVILKKTNRKIITKWETLRPKSEFSHGISLYCIENGWKISKFYKQDNSLAYIYCDIIDTSYDADNDAYIFTDLLADVIIENNGLIRVVDIDEMAEACEKSIIKKEMLITALYRLNALLSVIYNGEFKKYLEILSEYEK